MKSLPVNVMACKTFLAVCGTTCRTSEKKGSGEHEPKTTTARQRFPTRRYARRLWCAWELFTLFAFMDTDRLDVKRGRVSAALACA